MISACPEPQRRVSPGAPGEAAERLRKILAAHQPGPIRMFPLANRQQTTIGHTLKHSLAVLVARPGIPQLQRPRAVPQARIRFIDNNRWALRPIPESGPYFAVQRHLSSQRLFDKQEMRKKFLQAASPRQGLPKASEFFDHSKLFIAIQAEGITARRHLAQGRGDA